MASDMTKMMQDAIASSEAFKRQFDKADPSYHGGDPTPVPLGGSVIPRGMEGPADGEPPLKMDEANLGPSFQSVSSLRGFVMKTQTELNAIHRIMLSIHGEYINATQSKSKNMQPEKPDAAGTGNKEPSATALASLQENKSAIFSTLKTLMADWEEPPLKEVYLSGSTCSAIAKTVSTVKSSLESIISDAERLSEDDPREAVQHQQFVTSMRPLLQQLNRHKVALLQTIKDMKKEFSAHSKASANAGADGKKSEDSEEVLN